MILAYVHCDGSRSREPELCIVPDRPDQYSCAAPVASFKPTEAAVYRVGPQEALVVRLDESDGALIFEPVKPAKLFLTPDVHDQPGLPARSVKVRALGDGRFESFYQLESHEQGNWQLWNPTKRRVG